MMAKRLLNRDIKEEFYLFGTLRSETFEFELFFVNVD